MMGPLQNTITRYEYIVLDTRVDVKRGQDGKQRRYGIISEANILSFQGPNALQLFAI